MGALCPRTLAVRLSVLGDAAKSCRDVVGQSVSAGDGSVDDRSRQGGPFVLAGDHRKSAVLVQFNLGGCHDDFPEIERPFFDGLDDTLHHELWGRFLQNGQRWVVRQHFVRQLGEHVTVARGDELEPIRTIVWIFHAIIRGESQHQCKTSLGTLYSPSPVADSPPDRKLASRRLLIALYRSELVAVDRGRGFPSLHRLQPLRTLLSQGLFYPVASYSMMSDEPTADASNVQDGTGRTTTERLSRRRFAIGSAASVAALSGLAGCIGSAANGETVTILLTPENPSDIRNDYLPMKNYLEGEIDSLSIEYKVPQDYSAIRPALKSEQAEIGMDDITLISAPDMMDVFGTAVTGGTAWYFSMMLTNKGSGIEKRSDLKDKTVAFADKLSTSGSIFAVYTLKQAGLDVGDAPQGDPVDFEGTWSNHKFAVEKLANEEADACCTWGGNGMPHVEKKNVPEDVRPKTAYLGDTAAEEPLFKPIWWSFPIPKQPIYSRQSWESDMKGKIEQALHDSTEEMMKEYQPDDYDATLPFTTLRDTSIEDYQPVIKRLNDLGVELG
ncbi:phosphate/phosphite/phosphonate ABC transporter binding protein [Natrinema hispanicum]|uniref:Phosphate/phosphite/phosphonate ABC transporter binding protein n=2 Tax=Natrinema hispanicum TaxID=392421 RepID=A0A482Y487_9EURY|nr:phosphate/phosphite/phosphonate ABC transporter binding protein [Natrinema hispanicum]